MEPFTNVMPSPMSTLLLGITAFVLVAAAVYAHLVIARFTAGSGKVMISRAVLVVTGIAFGYVSATLFPDDPGRALLAILIGFGAVHFPAAFILFLKQAGHSGKT